MATRKTKGQSKLTDHAGYQRSILKRLRKRNIFPFLELPPEIRLQVYAHALPMNKETHQLRNACTEDGIHCAYEYSTFHMGAAKGFVALMCTSKLVYQETLGVLYAAPQSDCSPIVKIHVSDEQIRVGGYQLLCHKHHVFDEGAQGTFRHFRHVNLHVHAYCDPWPDDDDDPYADPDTYLQQSRQRTLKNNLRWVVKQLRKAEALSSMVVHQADCNFYEHGGSAVDFASDFRYIFQPLEAISFLDTVSITRKDNDGCSDLEDHVGKEVWSQWEQSYTEYELLLFLRMTSHDPPDDEPQAFNFYDEFVHNLKKCKLASSSIDTESLLHSAQRARDDGASDLFGRTVDQFFQKFEDELAQKQLHRTKVKSLCEAVEKSTRQDFESLW